jgi:hypothetical protein
MSMESISRDITKKPDIIGYYEEEINTTWYHEEFGYHGLSWGNKLTRDITIESDTTVYHNVELSTTCYHDTSLWLICTTSYREWTTLSRSITSKFIYREISRETWYRGISRVTISLRVITKNITTVHRWNTYKELEGDMFYRRNTGRTLREKTWIQRSMYIYYILYTY